MPKCKEINKEVLNNITDNSLIFHMRQTHMAIFRLANKRIDDYSIPIKVEQMPVLMSLYVYGDLTQQEIAEFIKRDKSSVHRTTTFLESKGLIFYKKDPTDSRKKLVSLSDTGNFVALQIVDSVKVIEDEIAKAITDAPKEELIAALKNATEKLEEIANS